MPTINVDIPENLRGPLFAPARYKVLHGGRGGGKSWSVARALIVKALRDRCRILCAREIQNSIADSVHRLLRDQIDELGLSSYFETPQAAIRCVNGSEFIFKGLRTNTREIKSTEGIDYAWVEEAETVSAASWDILIPTVRKEGSEIWITFNPREPTDPTYRRFVKSPPPGSKVIKVGWQDNPWLPDTLRDEKDYLYSVDPDAAAHVWGGETRRMSDAQVLRGKFVVEPFNPQDDWHGPYYGADWGFAASPTALVRCWVIGDTGKLERTLLIEHEAYGLGVDNDKLPALFDEVPAARKHTIRADCARPETISHMQNHGYPLVTAATKWPGSVEDGVAHLRGYRKIVIHSRCVHTAEEARLWSYKVDRLTGDVIPTLVDAHNHCWDSIRYALAPLIRNKQPTLAAPSESTGASRWG